MVGDQSYKKTGRLEDSLERVKYYRRHLVQYVLLVVVFLFSIIFLFQVQSTIWKTAVILIDCGIYFLFGLWHHIEEKNLSSKIVIEYLLISAIIFVALYSIFL